jgi:glucan 1,3-beta-glucosidase
VIDALVVGNEVFLRRELSVAKLRALLVEVRSRTGLPVTTADIWAFWPQDPALLETVSFMMVHILPYWDDQPVSIDAALPHVQQVYADMTRKFPGKLIMIGETGWPRAGRPRGALEPSRVNAARYVREFTAWATANDIRYNLIEAFDQPWKRTHEGTVGGFWGLFDRAGLQKFPLQGPVMENPRWRTSLGLSLGAGVLLPLAVAVWRRRALSAASTAVVGLSGLSAMGAVQWQDAYLQAANRDWLDWCATLAWAAAGWILAWLVLAALARWLDAPDPGRDPARHPGVPLMAGRLFGAVRFAVLLGAAYVALGLVLAGRHRDFPLALLAVPAVALLALEVAGGARGRGAASPREFLLATWLAVAAPLVVWLEGTGNSSALAVGGLFLVLAWPALGPGPEADQHQRAGDDADGREIETIENGANDARDQGQVSQRR